MAPKSLLRHPAAVSPIEALVTGRFRRVLPDVGAGDPARTRRVLLCSGKIYFALVEARAKREAGDVAIVRLEQLYPMPEAELRAALAPYPDGTPLVWVQEEPWNMGGWFFLARHIPAPIRRRLPLSSVARPESASPATGSPGSHEIEQGRLLAEAFGS